MTKKILIATIVALLSCCILSYILYKKKKYDELLEDCDKEFPCEEEEL